MGASVIMSACYYSVRYFLRLDALDGRDECRVEAMVGKRFLLGAVNIEQTKLLDFEDLKRFFLASACVPCTSNGSIWGN